MEPADQQQVWGDSAGEAKRPLEQPAIRGRGTPGPNPKKRTAAPARLGGATSSGVARLNLGASLPPIIFVSLTDEAISCMCEPDHADYLHKSGLSLFVSLDWQR